MGCSSVSLKYQFFVIYLNFCIYMFNLYFNLYTLLKYGLRTVVNDNVIILVKEIHQFN